MKFFEICQNATKSLAGFEKAGLLVTSLCFMLLITGCESTPTEVDEYDREAVLTAFIYNGEPIEEVFLERVAPLFSRYEFEDYGIRDADIKIFELNDANLDQYVVDASVVDSLEFEHDEANPGRYIPAPGESLIPTGSTFYRIEAMIPGGEFLWAVTSVPDTFKSMVIELVDIDGTVITVEEGDTLTRNDPVMFWRWEIDTTGGFVGGYAGFIIAETDRDSLVPLDPKWDAEEDSLEQSEKSRVGWTIYRYDARWTTIAWAFYQWEGPTRIELHAVDRVYWDYLYSSMIVQQGMLDNPIFNINGGIGIFGGITRKSFNIYMKKVPASE